MKNTPSLLIKKTPSVFETVTLFFVKLATKTTEHQNDQYVKALSICTYMSFIMHQNTAIQSEDEGTRTLNSQSSFECNFKCTSQQRDFLSDARSTMTYNRVKKGWACYNQVTVLWTQAAIVFQQRLPGPSLYTMDPVTIHILSLQTALQEQKGKY